MSGVRAVTRDDLPAVAELLALVLFHHPWPDAALPSLLAEDDTGDVIREIVCDAFMRGCLAVRGRVDPRFTLDLTDRGALLHATPAGMLVHARDAALTRQVERGQAWLGPLDGESWLPL